MPEIIRTVLWGCIVAAIIGAAWIDNRFQHDLETIRRIDDKITNCMMVRTDKEFCTHYIPPQGD